MSRFHKLLRVNLSTQIYTEEDIPSEYEKIFIGGKGIGTKYLVKELGPHIDPLGPENKFIIATGPLTGTSAPASSRYETITKSPLTGIYLDCNSGGHFAQEIKATGFDLFVIEGVSEKPVIIFINNNKVSFIDATNIWGMYIYDTENYVKKFLKDPAVRVMSIGPAGENLVRFASVSSDYSRQAARGGSGAVLGSKKVKAIAVKGTQDIPIANFYSFLLSVKKAREVIFNNPWVPDQRKYGTPRTITSVNMIGLLPVNNFTEGAVESVASIDEFAVEALNSKRLSCGECPIACARGYNRGKFSIEGPEYETIALLGPNIGVLDLNEIAEFNYYCNQYGLDTMSTGALIGALIASDKINFGEEEKKKEKIIKLFKQISYREGIGDVLAEGLRFAGKELDISYLMPEVKGLGIPAYDPRCSDGTALVYMTADRGACHLRSWPLGRELASVWGENDLDKKIDFVRNQQDEKAAEESLIVCQFAYGIGLLNEILPEMVNEATGEDWDLAKMKIAGERIWNLSKLFNIKEGMSRKDDYLPEKFAVEGIKSGPLKGKVISREKQDFMLDKYYELRGWTKKGVPTPETLNRLGIEEEI